MIKLTVKQKVGEKEGKDIVKSRSFAKINQRATDLNLKSFGLAVAEVLQGTNLAIVKTETTNL